MELVGRDSVEPRLGSPIGSTESRPTKLETVRVLVLGVVVLMLAGHADAASLAGQQVQPGGKIEIRFPVSKYFQDIASQAGNPRPETGRAVLAFPPGFDP